MRNAEMWLLLAEASLVDHRIVTDEIVHEWVQIVPEDITLAEAKAALLEHRRESVDYLMPAHIVQGVRAARDESGPSQLDRERAALDEFVAYTGLEPRTVAERWNDEPWKRQQLDIARKASKRLALEGGAA